MHDAKNDDQVEHLVMRAVYLPKDADLRLRSLAFTRGITVADLIHEFVQDGLVRTNGEEVLADKMQNFDVSTKSKIVATRRS